MEFITNKIQEIQIFFANNCFVIRETDDQTLTTIVTLIELLNEYHVYQNMTIEEHLSEIDQTTGIKRKGRMYFEELQKRNGYIYSDKNKAHLLTRMQKINYLYKKVMEILKDNHDYFFNYILTLSPITNQGKVYQDVLNYLIDYATTNNRSFHTITNLMLLSQSYVLCSDSLYKLINQTVQTTINNIRFDLTTEQSNKIISNLIVCVERLVRISRVYIDLAKPTIIECLTNDFNNDVNLIKLPSTNDNNELVINIIDNFPLIIYKRLIHIFVFLKGCKLWRFKINSALVEDNITTYYKYIKSIDEVNFDFEYQNLILTKIGEMLGRISIAREFNLKFD